MKKGFLAIIFILLTTSCVSRIENKGYSFELTDYQPKEKISSKNEIIKNMGSPTLISYIDDELFWMYFEEEIELFLFFKPKVQKRKILVITFDNKNLAKTVNYYDLANQNPIKFNENKTNVEEVKKGFFSDLFGNIGRVKPQ